MVSHTLLKQARHSLSLLVLVIGLLMQGTSQPAFGAIVSPIQANYGEVFPGTTNQSLEAFREFSTSGPWYVTFDVVGIPANVTMGAYSLPVASPFVECCFTVTAARIVTIEGDHVAFGTNNFTENPFSGPIHWLVEARNVQPGRYALAVSGHGNRDSQRLGNRVNATDFATRLTVTEVPEPASLYLIALGSVLIATRRRRTP